MADTGDEGETTGTLDVPPPLWRTAQPDHEAWVASAVSLLDLVARSFGLDDLSTSSVLDVGCGTKFTKVILDHGIPIGRYVGVDTSTDVIDFLTDQVDDPRFAFHHLDAHNDLYNAAGQPLDSFTELPVGDERFDIICLFSVFTHLAPHDYRAMLELLRPHVSPDGGLLFSLAIDEGLTAEARAAIDAELRRRLAEGDPSARAAIDERLASGAPTDGEVPDFVDAIPDQPLLKAVYSEPYARKLIEGTGWIPIALYPPEEPNVRHYFVCRPA